MAIPVIGLFVYPNINPFHFSIPHIIFKIKIEDKRLFDLLYTLKTTLNTDNEIHVISGYRSPKTNAMLAGKSGGVAKKSYHMQGMAMDIAIPGVKLKTIRDAALSLKLGGVGYYPKSGFVHVDCGPVRHW